MDVYQQFLLAVFVIALLGSSLWALKRRGLVSWHVRLAAPKTGKSLQLIERLQLTPQHAVCLIRFEHRTLLIGTAPDGCRVLEGAGQ